MRNVYIFIQKSRHFAKSKTIRVTYLFTKIKRPSVTWFFMNMLRLEFVYKTHDTLRYMMCLYTQNPNTLQKARQLRLHFIHKKPDIFCYTIFHKMFEIDLWIQKSTTLCITWCVFIQKARHFAKSKTICVRF